MILPDWMFVQSSMLQTALCWAEAALTGRFIVQPALNCWRLAGNLTAVKPEKQESLPDSVFRQDFVIHTPGPVWHGGNHREAELLKACYINSLTLASENNCKSLAFPCISTGVYRFPKDYAAEIALAAVKEWEYDLPEQVIFCCFSESDAEIYRSLLAEKR